MFQKLIALGRLGADPDEVRHSKNGKAVTHFPLAVNRIITDESGQRLKFTTWYRVTAWGAQAEACAKHLRKGDLALVDADVIQASAYLRDGQPAASLDISARTVRFISTRGKGEEASGDAEADPLEEGAEF